MEKYEISQELLVKLKKSDHAFFTEDGRELLNPVPLVLDVTPRPPTLQEQIKRLMRVELSRRAAAEELETWDEANDFDIDDEANDAPATIYQQMVDESPPDASESEPPAHGPEAAESQPAEPEPEGGEET